MGLPVRFTLARKPYSPGAADSHGNVVPSWGDAVDLPVCGMAPGANTEPDEPDRDLSLIEWTLYCPPDTVVSERDRVVLSGVEFEVDGRPKDWSKGPWPHPTAGVVVLLRRAEG